MREQETSNDQALFNKIEELRYQLVQASLGKKNLSDQTLVEISQKLDRYIVEVQSRNLAAIRRKRVPDYS
ncbi:aspartyl-phosphate phosphatase Spo0E family protein [Brevibacillus fulvus]|uniref:Aspartyl-phosphate phosphatase Spo0E family protein n=1 Tax=Brevibacillus fulvus TaxID=1125967 RepID=A0A938XW71_9BACL|nr:aspartyl-phosphate phosphatase Spo0E family protein [Brevibacillus fulvus]MBM7591292.1 hypothetical protein [Brevibacillus fulvus]